MNIIDHKKIVSELNGEVDTSKETINGILEKARKLNGISYSEVLSLMMTEDKELVDGMMSAANYIKNEIYGKRMVLFAPLYISNLCINECTYCAFKCSNTLLHRRQLSFDEIKKETEEVIGQGHKRVLLVGGEAYTGGKDLDYVIDSIKAVYSINKKHGNIRRVNVNVAPLSVEDFKRLNDVGIGTYQCFQETYHRETYENVHIAGPKSDYDYRLEVMDRAYEAGINDFGIGVLFGLYDWKYEMLALLQHIQHLEGKYGVGPHTVSVPRMEPALGSDISSDPPMPVSDAHFIKIIAILRMAVPYTGIILSTREDEEVRANCFDLGVSQISAGSKTNPGGYEDDTDDRNTALDEGSEAQFSLGDDRSLLEVVKDLVKHGHIPSFCTGCYRMGRVGKDFMDLAKPGLIKAHCLPNAIFTFAEYIYDFGDQELIDLGESLIETMMADLPTDKLRVSTRLHLKKVVDGFRDIYF
ncbi:MAG: [FeFe] hydrogenase H-cluster radical SAM maturase HydG [Bacteriovoracaceae bacterium]|nr:[FeFe] hydrogenase H-cluster radical SAM maturase HydG [Bacteriovoracaceae bacterium]